jgi:hypothetical protein
MLVADVNGSKMPLFDIIHPNNRRGPRLFRHVMYNASWCLQCRYCRVVVHCNKQVQLWLQSTEIVRREDSV